MGFGIGLGLGGNRPVLPQLILEFPGHGTALRQGQGLGQGAHSHGGIFVNELQQLAVFFHFSITSGDSICEEAQSMSGRIFFRLCS